MTRTLAACLGLALALSACAELQKGTGPDAALKGTCPAADHQDWVGQSLASVNAAFPENTRLLLPGAAATMDYRPDRMNVEVDKSDKVTKIYCG
jgi:hypothetical protein